MTETINFIYSTRALRMATLPLQPESAMIRSDSQAVRPATTATPIPPRWISGSLILALASAQVLQIVVH